VHYKFSVLAVNIGT